MTTTIVFDPTNWYWIVARSTTQVYSSAVGDYVPMQDATYQAWLAAGNPPAPADSVQSLGQVLAKYRLRPVNVTVLRQYQTAIAAIPDIANFPVMLDIENRVRVLEGQPTR